MPRVMIANVPIYFVILPETTYVILERLSQVRRIFTDGRAWPARLQGGLPSAIRSANGSTATLVAAMTRWKSRPAPSTASACTGAAFRAHYSRGLS
jgi:hypothetical protein